MAPSDDPRIRPRALLFPLPYQGHINAMLRLAWVLQARGLAITVLHTETRALDRVKLPADYDVVAIRDDVAPELAASDAVAPFVLALNKSCAAPFREYLAGVGRSCVACVVADVDWFAPLAAARELGVPALALMTSTAARFRVYLAFQRLEERSYLPVRECNLDTPVDELAPLLARDLHRVTNEDGYRVYANLLCHMVAGIRQSSGLIVNTFDAIEGAEVESICRDISIPVFAIGPLHMISLGHVDGSLLSADRSCLEWLDAQQPSSVVYATSLGSLRQIGTRELIELGWGKKSNYP